jgi:type II secretory pathway pseudopilin PulG
MDRSTGSSGSSRQGGFTLVEVAVSLFVTVTVILGMLALFDFSNKLSRVQSNVADMQQSLRVGQYDMTRMVRMAGRGGLPVGNLPDGIAVEVRNNVADGDLIGGAGTPRILPGTDVLTVRGVFGTSIYQVNSANPAAFNLLPSDTAPVSGRLRLASATPTGIPQDLQPLIDAVQEGRPEALVIVSPRDASTYAVVQLDPGNSDVTNPNDVTIGFLIAGGGHSPAYGTFSSSDPGVYPPDLTNVAFVGLVEEHRFYVREEFAVANDNRSDLVPKLARARVYPGTDEPWDEDAENWQMDIADNIIDLQIALGLDTPAGGCMVETNEVTCSIVETADGRNDDWLFNEQGATDPVALGASLHYVRVNTVARTDRRDWQYAAPPLVRVEDHDFATSRFNQTEDRMYRRRLLRTVVDMRNL